MAEAAASSTNGSPPVVAVARGYWQGIGGDINIEERAAGEIYNYDWYAIDALGPLEVRVSWDNGVACSHTIGRVVDRQIHLQEQDVQTTFVFHTSTSATVRFRKGTQTWIKQLEKVREDPTVVCF